MITKRNWMFFVERPCAVHAHSLCCSSDFLLHNTHTHLLYLAARRLDQHETQYKQKLTSLYNETISGNFLAHKSYKIAEIEWFWLLTLLLCESIGYVCQLISLTAGKRVHVCEYSVRYIPA